MKIDLVPCIVIDAETNDVLMLAYMNQTAFNQTLLTGQMTYYSRSRKTLWVKGETSGHRQVLKKLLTDCDNDTLLAYVEQTGPACHLGTKSCFQQTVDVDTAIKQFSKSDVSDYCVQLNQSIRNENGPWKHLDILKSLADTISSRRQYPIEDSYTNYLLDKGLDKILKKIGEESSETIIGAKNSSEEMISETADLIYHLLVLYENQNVSFSKVLDALARRQGPMPSF